MTDEKRSLGSAIADWTMAGCIGTFLLFFAVIPALALIAAMILIVVEVFG